MTHDVAGLVSKLRGYAAEANAMSAQLYYLNGNSCLEMGERSRVMGHAADLIENMAADEELAGAGGLK